MLVRPPRPRPREPARMAVGLGFARADLAGIERHLFEQLVPVDTTPGRETWTTDRLIFQELAEAEAISTGRASPIHAVREPAIARLDPEVVNAMDLRLFA